MVVKMIIVITGPTGVGKTKLSIELAKQLNGEIINADSTQVYKQMNIGTAKIKRKEQENIPHHLFSFINVDEQYSVYDYQIDGRNIIQSILNNNKTPIIVGGSGLYINALLYDYQFTKEDNVYDFDALTDDEMYKAIIKLNPNIKIDKKNRQRLVRAYAKYINNSEPITNDGENNIIYDDTYIIGLTTDRDILYDIINKRVDKMIEAGLIKEVRDLINKYGITKEIKIAIGYKEFLPYFKEEIGLDEVIFNIKKNSRNYAKRQYTWFNHKLDINWFNTDFNNFYKTVNEVLMFLNKR